MTEILVILSSTWKFAATFPVAIYLCNMSIFETLLYTNIGGVLGIVIFTWISKGIIFLLDRYWPSRVRYNSKPKKVFARRNRRLVLLKTKYGLPGVVILTPVLLSIPIGVFLITKYYGHKKMSYLFLVLGQFAWSLVYTILYSQLKLVIT